MILQAQDNGGIVTVDSAFGARLIAGGAWTEVVARPEPAPTKTARRARTSPAPGASTQE